MKNKFGAFLLAGIMGIILLWGTVDAGSLKVSADPTKSSDEDTVRTLEAETLIYGEEKPGTVIVVTVYNYTNGSSKATLYSERLIVGESGIYVISAPLPVFGEQYVSVAVNGRGKATRYYRYESDLGRKLSETYLNVYEFLSEEPR